MTSGKPHIGFIPTPQPVVDAMLSLAAVTAEDVIYDLGCGDGRVLITAAQRFGCRGVGIDIDPVRVQEAGELARMAGIGDRVSFHQGNLFEMDFSPATVVILYLLPHLNLRLRPQLVHQLRSGTRIISHDFDMGDWQPNQVMTVSVAEDPNFSYESTLYQWVIEHTSKQTG